jgi:hypothetical protein
MKRTRKPPASVVDGTPEELLERMKIFTRRIINGPKAKSRPRPGDRRKIH